MGGTSPIEHGGVIVDESGTILEIGAVDALRGGWDDRQDHALLMPGLLNCHVHLTDAGRSTPVPGGEGLNAWVRRLLAARRGDAGIGEGEDITPAASGQIAAMREAGVVAFGEVANDGATLPAIAASGMRCRFIHELIGFRGDRADDALAAADALRERIAHDHAAGRQIKWTLAAHAPYSVAPALMEGIVAATAPRALRFHQHLAEDPAERELYVAGTGAWRDFLGELGAWDESWRAPGVPPIEYYESRGWLNERFVAVHLADATEAELGCLAERGVRAILSPASNLHITGTLPRLDVIAAHGLRFALGTDGRGSNPDADVVAEARTLHDCWPDLEPGLLLAALTTNAADILQMPDLGALRVGTVPGLLAVEAAPDGTDIGAAERAVIASVPGERRLV